MFDSCNQNKRNDVRGHEQMLRLKGRTRRVVRRVDIFQRRAAPSRPLK